MGYYDVDCDVHILDTFLVEYVWWLGQIFVLFVMFPSLLLAG